MVLQAVSSATTPDVPLRLGRYEIVERLAAGGMGEVFLARVSGPGGFMKPVALKRIHPALAGDTEFIEMLYDEANVAAALQHPNIVRTVDVGSEGSEHYVVLDYVNGDPVGKLHRELKRADRLFPPWVVAWIGAQVAAALHAAHEAKSLDGQQMEIIHRDVSPSNIMLSDDGHPMLFDFGVAKAKKRMHQTSHGELKGKLPYMAPETFAGVTANRTIDVFALGVVLYELLTNLSPFRRDTDVETISALLGQEVQPPAVVRSEVDPRLSDIVMQAMSRERQTRYQTAAQLEAALRVWAIGSGAPHDAASVGSWLEQNFPERIDARRALLKKLSEPQVGLHLRSATSAGGIGTDPGSGVRAELPSSPSGIRGVITGPQTPPTGPQAPPGPPMQPFASAATPASGFHSVSAMAGGTQLLTPAAGVPGPRDGGEPSSSHRYDLAQLGMPEAYAAVRPRRTTWLAAAAIGLAATVLGVMLVFLLTAPQREPVPPTGGLGPDAGAVAPTEPAASTAGGTERSASEGDAGAEATSTSTSQSPKAAATAPAAKSTATRAPTGQPAKQGGKKGPLVREYE